MWTYARIFVQFFQNTIQENQNLGRTEFFHPDGRLHLVHEHPEGNLNILHSQSQQVRFPKEVFYLKIGRFSLSHLSQMGLCCSQSLRKHGLLILNTISNNLEIFYTLRIEQFSIYQHRRKIWSLQLTSQDAKQPPPKQKQIKPVSLWWKFRNLLQISEWSESLKARLICLEKMLSESLGMICGWQKFQNCCQHRWVVVVSKKGCLRNLQHISKFLPSTRGLMCSHSMKIVL